MEDAGREAGDKVALLDSSDSGAVEDSGVGPPTIGMSSGSFEGLKVAAVVGVLLEAVAVRIVDIGDRTSLRLPERSGSVSAFGLGSILNE